MEEYNPYEKSDLSDLPAFCRDSDGEHLKIDFGNLNDPKDIKPKILTEQYKAAIDVYLQNHIEYRQIQSQVTTILSALSIASFFLFYWTFSVCPYASLGMIFLVIYTGYVKKPLITSIYKNRHYHAYTAFLLRAIEDNFKIYNMPLRTSDYKNNNYRLMKKEYENTIVKQETSRDWKIMISTTFNFLFWTELFLAIVSIIKLLFYMNNNGWWIEITRLFKGI